MRASRIPSQMDCQTWLQGGGGMCSAEELLRGAGSDGELNEDRDGVDSGLERPEPGPGPTPGKTTKQEGGSQSLLACLPEQLQQPGQQQQQPWQRGRPRQQQQRGLGRGGQEQPEQGPPGDCVMRGVCEHLGQVVCVDQTLEGCGIPAFHRHPQRGAVNGKKVESLNSVRSPALPLLFSWACRLYPL
ncbi:uncharacterized protein FAM241A isoform X2 [Antechinus flavipes]|uniref:uncharacterized protein FAM241A isoform X2 n=1 Tax=Antechinus flavipes TaxID=38775 RepID=UPI002235BD2E|nr:uncharacterized protein FAM241A isoform X2 [Antechinus flavipes]